MKQTAFSSVLFSLSAVVFLTVFSTLPTSVFAQATGGANLPNAVSLFGDKLENADFPEGVWSINENGEITASRDEIIWSKEKMGMFLCSFEFKLSEGTNSGFVIQCSDKENWIPNSIEIQLLDDFEKDPDYHSCGAFYGFQAPKVNKTKKAGEWNEMAVFCMGNQITVALNGEVVNTMDLAQWTDDKKSPDKTDIEAKFHGRALASTEPYGYIGFQGLHGNAPMTLRNVKIVRGIQNDAEETGFVSLFGDKLENAEFDSKVWSIDEEGVMHANKDDVIWAKEEYENFVLDFEFKNTEKSNSGIVIKCTDKENWIPNSLEIQVFDSFGRKVDHSDCGAVYGRCAPLFNVCKAPGEWNRMRVICILDVIMVVLNDELTTIMDKRLWTDKVTNPDGTEAYSWLREQAPSEMKNKGFVGIQGLHGNEPVVYRNVKIKKL